MGATRGHKIPRHLVRHSLRRLFANPDDVGKGLYIGGSDSNFHHRHRHHETPSPSSWGPADSTTTEDPGAWIYRMPTREGSFRRNNQESDTEWRDKVTEEKLPRLDIYSQRKYVIQPSTPSILSSPSSPPASSPLSLSSVLVNNDARNMAASHHRLPKLTASHTGTVHPRHKIVKPSSAHSSFNPVANGDVANLPSSSSSSSFSSSHPHLLNLGSSQDATLPPLHHGSHYDPFPTSWEPSWNQSEVQCFNRTNGNYECWGLFNPEENETSSTPGTVTLFDEEYRFWALVLIIIPLLTVFGNVLVVMSVFKEKSLKTVTNYFICSLAVADIMVAVIVMPFAVYMEVMKYRWLLHDGLCDAWVASDVLGCTASILNLTAICVDRFIAVTQPIKYAKHKNSKRVFIMLAITWIISVAIAAPIALGVNYSKLRNSGDCQFFNSDFIIYSSMGSFYIPSVIMCFLYWKIYRVIRMRALKAKMAKQMREVDKKALQGVIENPTTAVTQNANDTGGVYGAEATVTTGLANIDNGRVTTYNTTKATTSRLLSEEDCEDNYRNNPNSNSDDNDDDDDDDDTPSGSGSANNNTSSKDHKKLGVASVVMQISPRFLRNMESAELISNPVAEELDRLENFGYKAVSQMGKNGGCVGDHEASASTSGGTGQTCANEAETPFTSMLCKVDETGGDKTGKSVKGGTPTHGPKKGVTKFNFHMRPSRKRKEKSSSRREKKATKTLAIVLGVFLVCWVPFFTLNIFNAICIRYDLSELPSCAVDPIFFSLFQWLGYINSFLNPVIYTIFNQEFRKAFRRLLTEPCR